MSDVGAKLERICKARDCAKELTSAPPARWENECEGAFSEFRVSCIHLRRDREALDTVGDKQAAWRFICKFCKERPFWHDRCNEVLRILMLCPAWMKEFVEDPSIDIKDLPPSIAEEFGKKADEVEGKPPQDSQPQAAPAAEGKGGGRREPAPTATDLGGSLQLQRPANMVVVVQRCARAKILVDEQAGRWGEIKRGLVVSVSFTSGAKQEMVTSAAKFLLTAKLSTADKWQPGMAGSRPAYGSDAESVSTLCVRGEEQGVLVMPQASLVSEIGKDDMSSLQYQGLCEKVAAQTLYEAFVESLHRTAKELISGPWAKQLVVVAGDFHGRQCVEMASTGPFMHSFSF